MKICKTILNGVYRIELEKHVDERGFFARSWCADEFAVAGFPSSFAQASISWNEHQHTLRGMHWQKGPYGEMKIVRCTRGRIHDVVVDLRPESPTYLQHLSVELNQDNRLALLIASKIAHGFLTLTEECEVHYLMDVAYVPDAARGARWDDPAFGITWPAAPAVISEKDLSYSDYEKGALVTGRRT